MSDKTQNKNNKSFVNVKSFVTAIIIIIALMIVSYVLTLIIPCDGIPFWKWLLSPLLVLGSEDKVTLIGVILFLLVIGGAFNTLLKCGIMHYMVDKIASRYADKKYKLMAVIIFFFMALGSLIGSFEEVVPMVPIIVTLAVELGWDVYTGLYMSLLAVGCGFAAGVFNPFTVGIAQDMANLPMFSGAWFRGIGFVLIYILLYTFTRSHAKSIDSGIMTRSSTDEFVRDARKDKSVKIFAIIMLLGIVLVLSTAVLTFLRDYSFVIISVVFLTAGIVSSIASGMEKSSFKKAFTDGIVSMLPAVVMILMASSIKFTLNTAGVLDTIIQSAITAAMSLPSWSIILFMYLLVLIMNFFIPSGSAKVVMLMPVLIPLAEAFGISSQLVIVAYAFGDGFSNTFYPTNPVTLISLGFTDTSYSDWFKRSGKFQLINLILTSGLLLFGFAIGF